MHAAPWSLAALLVLAALATPVGADGHSAAPAPGETVRWSGEVVLDEDVLVPAGATLVVEAGAVVRAAAYRPYHVDGDPTPSGPSARVVAEGRVVVEGTAEAPVTFLTTLTLRGSGADGSLLRHARFDAAATHGCALDTWGATYRVESSRFTNHTWAVCVQGGAPAFVGNVFLHNGFMERSDPGHVPCATEESTSRDGAEREPILVDCPPPGWMTRGPAGAHDRCWVTWAGRELCRGTGGVDRALSVEYGDVLVEANRFESNEGGLWLGRNASAVVRDNSFVDHRHGASVDAAIDMRAPGMSAGRRVLIEGNVFERNGDATSPFAYAHSPAGLRVGGKVGDWSVGHSSGDVVVRGNVFRANAVGAHLSGDAREVRFEENEFLGNGIGFANEHGTAVLESCRFDNALFDLVLVGGWGHVRLANTTFDPQKVRVEGEGVVVWEGGVIRNLTLAVLAVSVLTLLLTAVTETGRWVATKALLLVGYTRLARADLLAHPARERLVARLAREPGAHLRALAAEVGSYGAAVHHLSRLEREGLVRSARDGVLRRFYPAGEAPPDSPLPPVAARLLALAEARPRVGLAEAARALGCSKQLASYHAHGLAARGLLRIERAPRGGRALVPLKVEGLRP